MRHRKPTLDDLGTHHLSADRERLVTVDVFCWSCYTRVWTWPGAMLRYTRLFGVGCRGGAQAFLDGRIPPGPKVVVE